MENKTISIEERMKNQNFNHIYKAIFKEATWKVGTKTDPKKEWGVVKLSLLVPKDDGTTYVVDVEEFLSEKITKQVEPFTQVYVEYEHSAFNPNGKAKFIRIL